MGQNASPCKWWWKQRKVGPPHSGLWLSATVAGESAFKREGEGAQLSLGQPMVGAAPQATPRRVHPALAAQACLSRSSAEAFITPSHDTQRTIA